MCEGAALAESSKQKVPSTPDKLSQIEIRLCSQLPTSFLLAPLTPVLLLLCEPSYALLTNCLAAQVCKCWVPLFVANHKHAVCIP